MTSSTTSRRRSRGRRAAGEIQVTVAANPSHLEAVDPVVEGLARAEQTDRSQARGSTIRRSRSRSSSTATHPSRGRASSPRRSTSTRSTATRPAGRCTSSRTTRSGSRRIRPKGVRRDTRATSRRASTCRSSTSTPTIRRRRSPRSGSRSRTERSSGTTSWSISSATGGSATTSRTRPRTRSRCRRSGSSSSRRFVSRTRARSRPTASSARTTSERMFEETLQQLRDRARRAPGSRSRRRCRRPRRSTRTDTGAAVVTAVAAERLARARRTAACVSPRASRSTRSLQRQLERRREALREGGIDWGHAEALAFASLLEEGIPIRLSGQDTERGTFSHRHAVLHDPRTGETLHAAPGSADRRGVVRDLQLAAVRVRGAGVRARLLDRRPGRARALGGAVRRLRQRRADRRRPVHRLGAVEVGSDLASRPSSSPTATRATGRSIRARGSSGSSSSRRRTTSASSTARRRRQFFHLLRRQALDATARPLVVMTPKGLLRLREATSTLDDLALRRSGRCSTIRLADHATCRRLVLCSGKMYYDIVGARASRGARRRVAVARIEQLYPFPLDAVAALIASYPELREIVWAQEEPQNMGAWRSIPASARGGRGSRSARLHASSTSVEPGARARARDTRRCTSTSRTGSSARRSASARAERPRCADDRVASSDDATRGPFRRAASTSCSPLLGREPSPGPRTRRARRSSVERGAAKKSEILDDDERHERHGRTCRMAATNRPECREFHERSGRLGRLRGTPGGTRRALFGRHGVRFRPGHP